MTVGDALRQATKTLARISDTARLDAELLMAHALGVSRSDMLLRHGDAQAPGTFASLIERRARREPVAYIIGEQEFFGRPFIVTPDVLIPRADSEAVVEAALPFVADTSRVLDCGTGSGALLLTLLAERPGANGVGTDASLAVLAVAAANAGRLGLAPRARMLRRDWHEAGWADDLGQFAFIIANPPYVEADAALAPDVRDFEPGGALFAGPDGLDDYRALVPQLPGLLTTGGAAVLEIGATQGDAVEEIARASGFAVTRHRDLGGRGRALMCTVEP